MSQWEIKHPKKCTCPPICPWAMALALCVGNNHLKRRRGGRGILAVNLIVPPIKDAITKALGVFLAYVALSPTLLHLLHLPSSYFSVAAHLIWLSMPAFLCPPSVRYIHHQSSPQSDRGRMVGRKNSDFLLCFSLCVWLILLFWV